MLKNSPLDPFAILTFYSKNLTNFLGLNFVTAKIDLKCDCFPKNFN